MPKVFRIPNNEIHGAYSEWAEYAVSKKLDRTINQTMSSILEYAIDGPSSKCEALLQDFFGHECLALACIDGSYQRFLVYGLFRHAADRKSEVAITIHKGVKDGTLCFSLRRDDKKLAVFYLEANVENAPPKGDAGLLSGLILLADHISDLTRECRLYILYFQKKTITIQRSLWARKVSGSWRRSAKGL